MFFTLEASVPPSIRNLPRSIIHIQTIHKYIQAMAIHGIYVQRYSTIRGHRKCCQCEIVASTNYQLPITYPGLLTSPHIQPPVGTHNLPGEELHTRRLLPTNKPSNFNSTSLFVKTGQTCFGQNHFLPYGLVALPLLKPIRLRGGSGGAESCWTR